jgi:transposase InsO family protein
VPQKQPKRRRLWLNGGSCVRLRPAYPGHVWSYHFVQDRTHNGRSFRMLTIIDEFTRECLSDRRGQAPEQRPRAGAADGSVRSTRRPGLPALPRERPDDGSEFTAKNVRKWLSELSVKTRGVAPATPKQSRQLMSFIERGSPWENGYMSLSTGSCATNC